MNLFYDVSGGSRGGGRGDHPPLVAENFVCSNSNFSPTWVITPPLAVPPGRHPPPPSENPVSAPGCNKLTGRALIVIQAPRRSQDFPRGGGVLFGGKGS